MPVGMQGIRLSLIRLQQTSRHGKTGLFTLMINNHNSPDFPCLDVYKKDFYVLIVTLP